MLRAKIEQQVGPLSDEVWNDTCKIADSTLVARKNYKIRNDMRQVVILCIGISDAIVRGLITKKGIA